MSIRYLLLAGLLIFLGDARAQDISSSQQHRVRARQIAEPPMLDGIVDDAVWQAIEPAAGFVQQNPDEGAPATEPTEVRLAFDKKFLYIGVICFDSQPQNIVMTQNRRDAPLDDTDSVQILLDTFDDDQSAFIFGTTPTGVEFDAQLSKAGQARGGVGTPATAGAGGAQRGGAAAFNLNWDAVWDVRSSITERGWESEIRIPFRTLRYRPGKDTKWGLNVMRTMRRRNEQSFWAPVSRAFQFSQVGLAGELYGLETTAQRNLKLLPYALGGFSRDFRLERDQTEIKKNVGLDLKYSLTPGLTLDATFNTDFAQVEVDDEQINLTRFDLFFPEKRPFFLENSGTFEFGTPRTVELFFSRRIGIDENRNQVPIDAGARVSGKVGKYQVGLLNMQTREQEGSAPANNYGAARVAREFSNRTSVGGIFVSRKATTEFEDAPDSNVAYGLDANIGFGQYANWFNYVAKSSTPGLEGSDHTYASAFAYESTNHNLDLSIIEVGRNFNPELGFVRRAGYRKPTVGYRHTFYPKNSRIRSIFPHFQWNRWYTLGTNETESGFEHYHVDSRWQNGGRLGTSFNRHFERLDRPFEVHPGVFIAPGRYPFQDLIANFGTDPTATLFASGSVAAGSFYNGTIRSLNFSGGYRYNHNIVWTGTYTKNFVDLPQAEFNTDLVGLRFNWSFTPKSFLQTLSQYNSRTGQIGHNIRLGLMSTSSTGLFVVYNNANATRDYTDPHDVIRSTLSRALFVKFNYLLDY